MSLMKKLRVATLNLLFDDWQRWPRLDLVIAQTKKLNPDVLMLQEVTLDAGVAEKLTKALPGYHLSICPRTGKNSNLAQAIFTRAKPLSYQKLEIGQNRIAQKVVIRVGAQKLQLINIHAYFSPFRDGPRQKQMRRILEFANSPSILAGDFNALPAAKSLRLLRSRYESAYQSVHRHEPPNTSPSPLWRGPGARNSLRRAALWTHGGGAIDYIFVEKGLKVAKCQLAYNQPSSANSLLYPSDHFGLVADILI